MSLTAINLDQETLAKLDEAASFRSVSREDLLRETINNLADYTRYYRESVELGLKDIREGRVISDAQMQTEMDERYQRMKEARHNS